MDAQLYRPNGLADGLGLPAAAEADQGTSRVASAWGAPSPGDPEASERARQLWWGAVGLSAAGVAGLACAGAWPRAVAWSLPALVALASGLAALLGTRRGQLGTSAWLLVLGLWASIALATLLSGGLASPLIAAQIAAILAAGLLLDVRGTVVVAGLTGLGVAGLAAAALLGAALTPPPPGATLLAAPILLASFACVAGVIASAHRRSRRDQALRRRYERELEERNRDLERAETREKEINELTSEYFYSLRRRPDGVLENELIGQGFQRVTGYAPDEVDEELWWKMIHPDDQNRLRARERQSLEDRPTVSEHRIVTKSGEVRWLRDHSRVVVDPDGSTRLYGASHDVTEAKVAEAEREHLASQLRQSQKMEAVGRLAGGIAHDFNNLLTAISGFGEILLHQTEQDEEARFAADQILAAADSAAELTGQLMTFSRRPTQRRGNVDVDEVIRGVEPMLTRLLGETVEIRLALAGEGARVAGEPGLIEQIIVNLAVNARDAMPRGGALTISSRRLPAGPDTPLASKAGCLHVRVEDTGCGMESAVAARAFEPFFTTKATGEGTGLGLSTVYGIVQSCAGAIYVDSALGRGTRFDIYLPRSEGPVEESTEAELPRAGALLPKRILVAEDDDRVRHLIHRCLARAGHTVLEARNGEEALALAKRDEAPIDLLLSDVVMSGMDGVELCRRLRGAHPDLRVLLVSGYPSRPGTPSNALPRDVAFLQKPFGPRRLERKLEEVFGAAVPAAGWGTEGRRD